MSEQPQSVKSEASVIAQKQQTALTEWRAAVRQILVAYVDENLMARPLKVCELYMFDPRGANSP